MKQVTAYARSQQVEALIAEFMNMGIEEIKTHKNFSSLAGISRIKLLCNDTQVEQVRSLISHSAAPANYTCDNCFSVREIDKSEFLRSVT